LVGRTLLADESDRGKTDVVILSQGLWQRRFGADPAVIGRRVLIDGTPTTIVGVMPAAFAFPSAGVTFWKPFVIDRSDIVLLWASAAHKFIARLRPTATLDAARREIPPIALGLRHANVLWDPGPTYGAGATVTPLLESLVGGTRPLLTLLTGCALLVLLIACVNVANLLLARASARERELAVRAALGGGRGRLIRQLLTESVVVSFAGAVAGLSLAALGLRSLVSVLPAGVPRASEITMNEAALGFTAAVALLTGIAFGLLPALRATSERAGTGGVAHSGRTGRGASHQRVSAFLVAGEVALAVLVVIGAELLVRSFRELRRLDPGFQTTHIVAVRLTPPHASYADATRMDAFYTSVLSRAAGLRGIQSVGAVSKLPLAEQSYSIGLRIEGQFEDATHVLPTMDHTQLITPGYISTMGIRLLRGRDFTNGDRGGSQPVAIISQSMANRYWPNDNPIGKRVGYPVKSPWMTIVGVVADVRLDSLRDASTVTFYAPYLQRFFPGGGAVDMAVVAKTDGDASRVGAELRSVVASVDRSVPVSEVETMDAVVSHSVAKPRFTMVLVGAFALVALVLGAVGIYGVMSYLVSQRRQELGIRAALGASSGDILTMVVARGAVLAGVGALVGSAAALVAIHPLRALLYGVSTTDPVTYVTVPLLFVAVALAASFAPALRATRVSPTSVLRAD
jgi:putative ABC transport system permease protein